MGRVIRRYVDQSCGHCFPPRAAYTGSHNVKTNWEPTVKRGDWYPWHWCGFFVHDGIAWGGSHNVKVNWRPIHRKWDIISCGDYACNGSHNVCANWCN